jgi:hypothetical protein
MSPGPISASQAQNDQRFDDFMGRARAFGRASAEGVDALPMFAIDLMDAATSGVITLEKPAKGEKDHAALAYDAYLTSMSKKLVHSEKGQTANASKVRQIVAWCQNPNVDPLTVRDKAINYRKVALQQDQKVKAVFPMLVEIARVMKDRDTEMTDDEIKAIILKDEPTEKTVEGQLEKAKAILEGLITGEAGIKDQAPQTIAAFDNIKDRLSALKVKDDQTKLVAKLRELGRDDQANAVEAAIAA